MATGLLVIRMSRPFAAKSSANWVMKKLFLHGAYYLHTRVSGLVWAS